jgi:hypothetical protein
MTFVLHYNFISVLLTHAMSDMMLLMNFYIFCFKIPSFNNQLLTLILYTTLCLLLLYSACTSTDAAISTVKALSSVLKTGAIVRLWVYAENSKIDTFFTLRQTIQGMHYMQQCISLYKLTLLFQTNPCDNFYANDCTQAVLTFVYCLSVAVTSNQLHCRININ